MKTVFDFEKEIINELKEKEYLTIHDLQKKNWNTFIPRTK